MTKKERDYILDQLSERCDNWSIRFGDYHEAVESTERTQESLHKPMSLDQMVEHTVEVLVELIRMREHHEEEIEQIKAGL